MKIIITEQQSNDIKKLNQIIELVSDYLSKYDWFVSFDLKKSKLDQTYYNKVIPVYVFELISSSPDYMDVELEIGEEIDFIFTMFFPYDNDNKPSALWSWVAKVQK